MTFDFFRCIIEILHNGSTWKEVFLQTNISRNDGPLCLLECVCLCVYVHHSSFPLPALCLAHSVSQKTYTYSSNRDNTHQLKHWLHVYRHTHAHSRSSLRCSAARLYGHRKSAKLKIKYANTFNVAHSIWRSARAWRCVLPSPLRHVIRMLRANVSKLRDT